MVEKGYGPDDARARICQDIILKAISESSLSRNVTIKGGVVMRSMTDNINVEKWIEQDCFNVFVYTFLTIPK